MHILIVGGAGYIGSHMVKLLLERGHMLTVFDNLSSGYRDAVDPAAEFIHGDLSDRSFLNSLLSRSFDGIMHFASSIDVKESVSQPNKYYRNNLINSLNLLDAIASNGGGRLIFSSTAAIFGNPLKIPIDEHHPCSPINPYGRSKFMLEQALGDYEKAHGIQNICLRYFNAAGAALDGSLGERHQPETHLIPLVLKTAAGHREYINIFGDDYDTPDGTCIRDYVHVMDICEAHLLALERLVRCGESSVYNLGSGKGFSVREIITTAEEVTGRAVPFVISPRRAGDPAQLVADVNKSHAELGWRPQYAELSKIISDAWRWEVQLSSR
jgi:UDP-glucose 4-epimerase